MGICDSSKTFNPAPVSIHPDRIPPLECATVIVETVLDSLGMLSLGFRVVIWLQLILRRPVGKILASIDSWCVAIARKLIYLTLCLTLVVWMGCAGTAIAAHQGFILPLTAVSTAPSDAEKEAINTLFDQAFEATSRSDFASAETYWTSILETYPNNAAVWSNRGNARVSQHKLEEALADYNQSIALAPDQPDPYLNRGAALEGLQQWESAIADYNHVLALEPNDVAAYNNRGNAKSGAGDWQSALADFERAAQLNPGFAMARANCALALYQLGQSEEAIHQFRNLVRKYPQFADMRAALAAALWAQGQRGEAESQWVAVVGLDSRYRNLEWVETIRRWPPKMADALAKFLSLQIKG